MKSLKAQHSILADIHEQLEIIEHGQTGDFALVPFQEKLEQSCLFPLKPTGVEVFQVNIGKMCNQVCRHCHVDAGPDRQEIMSREGKLVFRPDSGDPVKVICGDPDAPEGSPARKGAVVVAAGLVLAGGLLVFKQK